MLFLQTLFAAVCSHLGVGSTHGMLLLEGSVQNIKTERMIRTAHFNTASSQQEKEGLHVHAGQRIQVVP
jgi:hypothetical protein